MGTLDKQHRETRESAESAAVQLKPEAILEIDRFRNVLDTSDLSHNIWDEAYKHHAKLTIINDRIGEIADIPTANTLQDRLRDAQTKLASIDTKVATNTELIRVGDRIGEVSDVPTTNTLQDRLRDAQVKLGSIDAKVATDVELKRVQDRIGAISDVPAENTLQDRLRDIQDKTGGTRDKILSFKQNQRGLLQFGLESRAYNLLANPSFEFNTMGWKTEGTTGVTLARVTDVYHLSGASGKVTVPADVVDNFCILSTVEMYPCCPKQQILVTGWLKTDADIRATLGLRFYDSKGAKISDIFSTEGEVAESVDWVARTFTTEVPDGVAFFTLIIKGWITVAAAGATRSIWVDDLHLPATQVVGTNQYSEEKTSLRETCPIPIYYFPVAGSPAEWDGTIKRIAEALPGGDNPIGIVKGSENLGLKQDPDTGTLHTRPDEYSLSTDFLLNEAVLNKKDKERVDVYYEFTADGKMIIEVAKNGVDWRPYYDESIPAGEKDIYTFPTGYQWVRVRAEPLNVASFEISAT